MSANLTTAVNGAFCPIPTASLLAKRLQSGLFRFTDLGLEQRCSNCRDYWPADTEFFYSVPSRPGGLYGWCKACYDTWRRETGRTKTRRRAYA